jgi:hypothetical protein
LSETFTISSKVQICSDKKTNDDVFFIFQLNQFSNQIVPLLFEAIPFIQFLCKKMGEEGEIIGVNPTKL